MGARKIKNLLWEKRRKVSFGTWDRNSKGSWKDDLGSRNAHDSAHRQKFMRKTPGRDRPPERLFPLRRDRTGAPFPKTPLPSGNPFRKPTPSRRSALSELFGSTLLRLPCSAP